MDGEEVSLMAKDNLKGYVKVYDAIRQIEILIDDLFEMKNDGEHDIIKIIRYAEGTKKDIRNLDRIYKEELEDGKNRRTRS